MIRNIRKYYKISGHISGWLLFAITVMFSQPGEWFFNQSRAVCLRQIVLLILFMAVFYTNIHILIPRFYLQKKKGIYLSIILAILSGAIYLNNLTASYLYQHKDSSIKEFHPSKQEHHFDIFVPAVLALMFGLGMTISMTTKWEQELSMRERLEKEKFSTELAALKAQINPHFFFNTLNTIYSYTISNPDIARSSIASLSKMMRYVLYESEAEQTTLAKEVEFVRKYVDLMKLRITPKTNVSFEFHLLQGDMLIAPMLFQPFIENAFKHGVSNAADGYIHISIVNTANIVELCVINKIHKKTLTDESGVRGIGILNTRRRLELLYPEKYILSTEEKNFMEYKVSLKLFI